MNLNKIIYITLVLLLVGCSASQEQQEFNSAMLQKSTPQGMSEVYILRKATPPMAFNTYIMVNGEKLASLPINSYTHLVLDPGEYNIESKWPILAATPKSSITLSLKANQKYFLNAKSSIQTLFLGAYSGAEMANSINNQSIAEGMDTVKNLRYVPAK